MAKSFSFEGVNGEPKPRGRPKAPTSSQKVAVWPPPEPTKHAEDELLTRAEAAVITLLTADLDAKDMNAAIANAVRLIQVKYKIKPDSEPESFWNNDG